MDQQAISSGEELLISPVVGSMMYKQSKAPYKVPLSEKSIPKMLPPTISLTFVAKAVIGSIV